MPKLPPGICARGVPWMLQERRTQPDLGECGTLPTGHNSAQTLHTFRRAGETGYMDGKKWSQRSFSRKKMSETKINSSDVHLGSSIIGRRERR